MPGRVVVAEESSLVTGHCEFVPGGECECIGLQDWRKEDR